MHETSLARALLQQVQTLAREQRARRVVAIRVSVGALSGVEPDLFGDACRLLMQSALMRGAELRIQHIPLAARCNTCLAEFNVKRFQFVCPTCSGQDLAMLRGQDIILDSVTFENDVSPPS